MAQLKSSTIYGDLTVTGISYLKDAVSQTYYGAIASLTTYSLTATNTYSTATNTIGTTIDVSRDPSAAITTGTDNAQGIRVVVDRAGTSINNAAAVANDYAGYFYTSTTTDVTAGTINLYGIYAQAVGKTGGTSTAYGIYAKASGADTNYAIYGEGSSYFKQAAAADTFTIATTIAPTTDGVVISNAGYPTVTDGVNGLQIDYYAALTSTYEASATRINITNTSTTNTTKTNALRISATGSGTANVITNGIKLDITAADTGTSNAMYASANWDNILNYNGTALINGVGEMYTTKMSVSLWKVQQDGTTNSLKFIYN